MDEKRRVPKLRFPGFTEPWEQRKLSDIYKDIGNAFVGTATPHYVEAGHFYLESNNIKDGQINHNTEVFINDEFYEKQKDKWLHTGDMVMVQSGHVGHTAVIPEELDCSAAHALIMFRNPKVNIDPYFLNFQYQTVKAKRKIENITTGNTIKHILASEMQEFVVDVSSYDEQEKIAGFFRNLDNLITLHQRKLDEIKVFKKGMLQKMFPKKGEVVPEIRFPGFTAPWEQRKLGEMVRFSKGTGYSKGDLKDSGTPIILYGRLYTKYETVISEVDTFVDAKENSVYSSGGEVIVPASGETAEEISIASVVEKPGILLGGDLNIITPSSELDSAFLALTISNGKPHDDMARVAQGKTVVHLHNSDLKKIDLSFPSHEEQVQISNCFNTLDNLITLHQRKLEAFQEYKKGLLQKMFV
ncbi:MAG: restriction endonuclease subunit S [Lachnospiraceae bacterium]|nr:restriction endonuclease subunit S [Lachnospiraceae bacterium]